MAYLHLIITKVLAYCMQMYTDPVTACDEISALGLRHVGYAIPIELLLPFSDIIVNVIRDVGADDLQLKAFSFSLMLVANMMGRVIAEGSTIVMKAVNVNSPDLLKKAVACAARGKRAEWMLLVKVGTRDISPFLWSVQSGALDAAYTMLEDLLTIRADRDKYYFEADYIFRRHPDIVNILLQDAPTLVRPLLDGLIWRSRLTKNGLRRTNYYLKHLLQDSEGKFNKTMEWIVEARDPKLMVHPMLVLLSEVVWSQVALRSFLKRKVWFILALGLFLLSQSILKSANEDGSDEGLRIATFVLRLCIYLCSMVQMVFTHAQKTVTAYLSRNVVRVAGPIKMPAYLTSWQEAVSLLLMFMLVLLLCTEPILHCLSDLNAPLFSDRCEGRPAAYYAFSTVAMVLYFIYLMDLAVVNNRVSAYVLVCGRMLGEVALFIFALAFLLLSLSAALSCLQQSNDDFRSIPRGFMAMFEMLLGVYDTLDYEVLSQEPVVRCGVYVYLVVAIIFLLNLLVAQLTCSYDSVYSDMVGYARLKRSRIIVETMPTVSVSRWTAFKDYLAVDSAIEFNEGDVGIPGGIQVEEPASAYPTTVDTIKRVGGTTSPLAQWPEEVGEGTDHGFGKMELMIKRALDSLQQKGNARSKLSSGQAEGSERSGRSGSGDLPSSSGLEASGGEFEVNENDHEE
eukprot:TRINITY_DN5941_c0_g4_i1.p1 TRINITY_DN5941_c0_g4~~TRINITY_DN5941_c0_g4_i1.p1  ORF type:complete len:680 (-),score=136.68 TRINITY_DN5941_c0_g4_i1:277-2316(-)